MIKIKINLFNQSLPSGKDPLIKVKPECEQHNHYILVHPEKKNSQK
jgi:hypothetical protein